MPTETWKVSPKFSNQHLNQPVSAIDVFEDQIRGWVFDFAHQLAGKEHSGIAVLMLATSYFEQITSFRLGQNSEGKSKGFFREGVRSVFPEISQVGDQTLDQLYAQLRCGLFHTGFIKPGLILVPEGKPIEVLTEGQLVRLKICPNAFLERVVKDFDNYISQLRSRSDQSLIDNFKKMWELRGGQTPSPTPPLVGPATLQPESIATTTSTRPDTDPSSFVTEL